ncbi:hypothetical protein [Microcoleus vaginatus]
MPVPQRVNFLLVGWASSPPGHEQAFGPVPQRVDLVFVGWASCPPITG